MFKKSSCTSSSSLCRNRTGTNISFQQRLEEERRREQEAKDAADKRKRDGWKDSAADVIGDFETTVMGKLMSPDYDGLELENELQMALGQSPKASLLRTYPPISFENNQEQTVFEEQNRRVELLEDQLMKLSHIHAQELTRTRRMLVMAQVIWMGKRKILSGWPWRWRCSSWWLRSVVAPESTFSDLNLRKVGLRGYAVSECDRRKVGGQVGSGEIFVEGSRQMYRRDQSLLVNGPCCGCGPLKYVVTSLFSGC